MTVCPAVATQCPPSLTRCPVVGVVCPPTTQPTTPTVVSNDPVRSREPTQVASAVPLKSGAVSLVEKSAFVAANW